MSAHKIRNAAIYSLLAVLACGPASAQQAEQAGVSAAVRGEVLLASAAGAVGRHVVSGEPIFLGNAISSGPDSGMQVLLLDETVFTIGPNSEISIDEFVYDPASGAGKLTANMTRGLMRFVTGKVAAGDPQNMTINLPVGSIGIRGTMGSIISFNGDAGRSNSAVGDAMDRAQQGQGGTGQQPVWLAILNGPGSMNNTGGGSGSFTVTGRDGSSQTLQRDGFGVLLTNGTVSPPFQAPLGFAELQQLSSPGSQPGGQGGVNGQPPQPGQAAANAVPSVEQSGRETGQQLAVVLDDINVQRPGFAASNEAVGVSQDVAGAGGGAFTFDALRQVTAGSYSATTSVSGSQLSYSFHMTLDFAQRTAMVEFSEIQDGVMYQGGLGGNTQSFDSLTGPASFPDSFLTANGDCLSNGCNGSVSMTDPFNADFSLSTSNVPTAVGGSVTLQ